jgi:hypothetical protein
MRTLIILIRLLALAIGFVGVFTVVIVIGFVLIGLAQDLWAWSEKLELKLIRRI